MRFKTKIHKNLRKHEMNIRDAYEKIDTITEARNILNNSDMYNTLNNKNIKKILEQMEKEGTSFKGLNWEEMKTEINKKLNAEEETARNLIYDTKTAPDTTYDNRTDPEIRDDKLQKDKEDREDNAYERAVQDMIKAGLNPAGVMGGAMSSGGGGGGSESNSQKEEEEKKHKKREEEERKRAEAAQKQKELMQMLGMISGIGGMLTLGTMQNAGRQNQEHIRGQYRLDTQKQRDNAAYVRELEKKERMGFYKEGKAYFSR